MPHARRHALALLAALSLLVPVCSLLVSAPANAAAETSTAFSGGAGTVSVGGTLYAKSGGALTLTVATSVPTQCVDVSGDLVGHDTSPTAKSTWTFTFTAGDGNGAQSVTVAPSRQFTPQGDCKGETKTGQASYTLDNTGPSVTSILSPAPNPAGWNKADVQVTWTATDSGSGVAGAQPFENDTVTAETAGVPMTATATDELGNEGTGSVTVKLDKTAPSIDPTRSPGPNAAGWNNSDVAVSFNCSDTLSGIKSCTGGGSVAVSAEGANQSVSGTAVDYADNTNNAGVSGINIDKTAPTLTGAPTTAANGNGWYNDDVTIGWTASDALSGLADAALADRTITGEGSGLKASASVSDKAGNATSADSAPVNIDRTAPTTGISGTSNNWTNGDVTVSLSPSDNLSGVASTSYSVDGGEAQTGTTFALSAEGDHTVTFFSTDKAGNAEAARTAYVKIDKTAPTITHTFPPLSYTDGAWTNRDVTVTFACADQGGSGVADCTAPVTKTAEGEGQQVVGTGTDNAGNSASDTAVVSIDKTAPTISAAADRPANDAGWYTDDVTVAFACADALSGIATCPAPETVGEGADQSASGTATDAAGNSASAGVTGINVDKTPPTLTASFPSGWHTGDVTVIWSCTDALSGPVAQPAADRVTGEGANLSSTASCTDRAGNTATKTVSGIQIDRTSPTTSASVPDPLASGWYQGAVQVTLTRIDAMSGVDTTFYSVDGGAAETYMGAFSFGTKGVHTIAFWSTDNAGNVEDKAGNSITLKIDGISPTTTVINPISPASGWFVTSGIPVAFDANDEESGIAATYYSIDGGDVHTYGKPFTADLSTGSHTIVYWSVDLAGNVEAKRTTLVKVDTVPPTISGTATPAPNAFGWNNTDVAVTFTCHDADSGIAGCAGDTTLANDGAEQMVPGEAVDVAGNPSSTDLGPVNIDQTKPILTGAPTTDPNGAGWYRDDVTIAWAGADALSGIDPATQPANSTITGEGDNLGAGPETIADKAGNVSDPASVTGIKIDRTAPVVAGGATSRPNAAGWYKDQVVVDFTCTDNLSGVAYCPTSRLLKGDGANQSVTSDPATDFAGNASAGTTVGGINIDGTAPTTTSDNQCAKTNGWCTGPTANVVLTSTDQAGLSGVKEIHYRIDGGAEQVAAGATRTVSVPLDGSGEGTVTYWAVDHAGNAETAKSVALKWDNIAPTVTHTLAPRPNADGWNNSDVTVHFDAKDDDAGSGVDLSTVTKDVVVSTETGGLVVDGSATDTAGNVGNDSVTVRLDKTAPTIGGAIVSGAMGSNGWYVGPVTVHFTCSDALSGVATCPDDVTLTTNGVNTASGTASDKAGNTASASVGGITIDQEKPTITGVNVNGGSYVLGAVPAASCTATDDFAGLASCTVTVSGGTASGVGTFTYTATAIDKAGNTTLTTGTYKVTYRFDGFLQPINDTAHQVGTTTSIFKADSTVPAKFQLKKADGTLVQATTAPVWLTPVKSSQTSAPVDESSYTASADSGSTYRYAATARQYIYNWKTGNTGGNYWRIGVTLDDGQTYFVNIGLR